MSDKSVTFSPREMEVLALAWQCMETQPKVRLPSVLCIPPAPPHHASIFIAYALTQRQIDMDKLAALTGYTPGSASVTLGKIKQKIKLVGSSTPAAPITPKRAGGPVRGKASSAKRGAAKANDDDESPSKKRKAPAKKIREEDIEADDDEEQFMGIGIKKEQSPEGMGSYEFYDQAREAAGYEIEDEEP
jgi:hypothetical protein